MSSDPRRPSSAVVKEGPGSTKKGALPWIPLQRKLPCVQSPNRRLPLAPLSAWCCHFGHVVESKQCQAFCSSHARVDNLIRAPHSDKATAEVAQPHKSQAMTAGQTVKRQALIGPWKHESIVIDAPHLAASTSRVSPTSPTMTTTKPRRPDPLSSFAMVRPQLPLLVDATLTGPQQAPTPSAGGLTPDQVEQFRQVFDVFVGPLSIPSDKLL